MPRSSKSKCRQACRVPTIVLQPAPVVMNKVNIIEYMRRPLTRSEEITLGKLLQEAVDDRVQDLQVDLASSQTTNAVRAAFVQEIVVAMLEQRSKQVISDAQDAMQGGELKVRNASLISTAKVSELLIALNALKDQPMSVEAAMSLGELLELLTGAEKLDVADAWKRNDEYSFDAWNSITNLRQKALDLKRCTKLLSVKNDELETNLKKTQAAFGALHTYKDEASEAVENAKQSGVLTDAQKQALKRLQAQMSKSAVAYQEAQAQAAVLKAEYEKNQQALADAEAKLKAAQDAASQAGQRHEQLLEDCNAGNAHLTQDLAACESDANEAKDQLQQAQADLTRSEVALGEARGDAEAKQLALENASQIVEAQQKEIEDAREALVRERAEFDAQKKEAQVTFAKELDECMSKMDEAVRQHEAVVKAQVQEHKESCEEAVTQAQEEKQTVINKCEERATELEAELKAVAAASEAQTAQAQKVEEKARQVVQKTFEKERDALQSERNALQRELDQCEKVRSALQEAILQGNDTAEKELSELRNAMQNIKREKGIVDGTRAKLESDCEEHKRASAKAQTKLNADLKAALEKHREAVAMCARERKTTQEASQKASQQALADREAALQKTCDDKVLQFVEKIDELDTRYNMMREKAEEKARLVTEQNEEIQRLANEIKNLETEKKTVQEEKIAVEASVNDYADEIVKVEKTLAKQHNEALKRSDAECQARLQAQNASLEAENAAALEQAQSDARARQATIQEEIDQCTKGLAELEAVNTRLQAKNQTLTSEKADLEAAKTALQEKLSQCLEDNDVTAIILERTKAKDAQAAEFKLRRVAEKERDATKVKSDELQEKLDRVKDALAAAREERDAAQKQNSCPGSTDLLSLLGQDECPKDKLISGPVVQLLQDLGVALEYDGKTAPLYASDFEPEANRLVAKARELKQQFETQEAQSNRAKEACASLETKTEEAEKTVQGMEQQLAEKNREVIEILASVKEQKALVTRYSNEKDNAKRKQREAEAKVRQLEKQQASQKKIIEARQQKTLEELRVQVKKDKVKISKLETAAKADSEQKTALETLNEDLSKRVQKVVKKRKEWKGKYVESQKQLAKLEVSASATSSECRVSLTKEQTMNATLQNEITTLKASSQQQLLLNNALTFKLQDSQDVTSQLKQKISELETAVEENVKTVQTAVKEADTGMKSVIQKRDAQISTLQNLVKAYDAFLRKVERERDSFEGRTTIYANVVKVKRDPDSGLPSREGEDSDVLALPGMSAPPRIEDIALESVDVQEKFKDIDWTANTNKQVRHMTIDLRDDDSDEYESNDGKDSSSGEDDDEDVDALARQPVAALKTQKQNMSGGFDDGAAMLMGMLR